MREICSYGSVGERGGNEPLYPEDMNQGYILAGKAVARFWRAHRIGRKEVISYCLAMPIPSGPEEH